MSEGFTTWLKKDLLNFVHGCELYGRDDLPGVATEVEGKTEKEVGRYACTFFKRYDEIKEGERLMRRIREGESRLARKSELDAAIAKKLSTLANPWLQLRIDWGGPRPRSWFTEECDRYLVCLAHSVGYGRWEDLVREVRRSWLFKFDWFMKTRVPHELGERVEMLAELIEKQVLKESKAGKARAGSKRPLEEAASSSRKK